jgi:hypothetical protein
VLITFQRHRFLRSTSPTSNTTTPPFTPPPALLTMRADCLPHARVSVLVNGAALTEYSTESDDGLGATTFVEAVPGAAFTVELEIEAHFRQLHPKDRVNFILYLDGEYVSSILLHMEPRPVKNVMDGAREQTDHQCMFRPFLFAQHETSMLSLLASPSTR